MNKTLMWALIILIVILAGIGVYSLMSTSKIASQPGGQTSVKPGTGTPLIQMTTNAALGSILSDNKGVTLYYRTLDAYNQSNCAGACSQTWPPLLAPEIPTAASGLKGVVGLITRSDGARQVTYNGWPLYYYSGDKNPGDTKGQGINSVWYVVLPDIKAGAVPASTTPTNTNGTLRY